MPLRMLRATAVACLTAGLLLLLPSTSTAAPALHLSRTNVIAGESVTVTGSIGGTVSRPVQLQRRSHDAWVRIATVGTSRKGGFSFRYTPPAVPAPGISLRVVAPATRAGSRRLTSLVTSTATVNTVATSALIQAPSSATATAPVTVKGAFSPARPGRPTQVQRWNGSAWSPMVDGSQDSTGATSFDIGIAEAGTRSVRVVTLAEAGAPQTASVARKIVVAGPPAPSAAAGPSGVTAIAGDADAIVTWDPVPDVAGYRVYSAPALTGPWTELTTDPLAGDHEATFTASGLTNGATYAFAVTSLGATGAESAPGLSELVVPVAPVTPPTDDLCGPELLKPDGSAWSCTLADGFDGTGFDPKTWYPQQAFATGTSAAMACYRNTPDTISVGAGVLSLSVVKVAEPVSCTFGKLTGSTDIIAGSLMSYQRFTQQYGRFEARIKTQATALPGLQETFWLWPDDRFATTDKWPVAGEMDVSESYSNVSHLAIPFLHYRLDTEGPKAGVNTAYCAAERGEWNTYTLTWTADRIQIDVNGKTCLVNTSGDTAFMKPYLIALTAALGVGDNEYDGRVPLPATMQVDYVRAWK